MLQGISYTDDLPIEWLLYATIHEFVKKTPIPAVDSNETFEFKLCILVRWYKPGEISICEEHIIEAAKAYDKDNIRSLIYNSFTAFELTLSDLVEKYWKKILTKDQYKCLNLDRISTTEKMRKHLKLICTKTGILDTIYKSHLENMHKVRMARNNVVHSTTESSHKIDKHIIYGTSCWFILFFKFLESKLENLYFYCTIFFSSKFQISYAFNIIK